MVVVWPSGGWQVRVAYMLVVLVEAMDEKV
jgi:hypothetical protein